MTKILTCDQCVYTLCFSSTSNILSQLIGSLTQTVYVSYHIYAFHHLYLIWSDSLRGIIGGFLLRLKIFNYETVRVISGDFSHFGDSCNITHLSDSDSS